MITLAKLRKVLRLVPSQTSKMDEVNTCKVVAYTLWRAGIKNFSVNTWNVFSKRTKIREYHTRIEVGGYIVDYKLADYYKEMKDYTPFITQQLAIYSELLFLPAWRKQASKENVISKASLDLLLDLYDGKSKAGKKKTSSFRNANAKDRKIKAYQFPKTATGMGEI